MNGLNDSDMANWIRGIKGAKSDELAAERLTTYLKPMRDELGQLRSFVDSVMAAWPEGDLDGGDLQEAAIAHGLLTPKECTGPCCVACFCAEYHGDGEAWICYRPVKWLAELRRGKSTAMEQAP